MRDLTKSHFNFYNTKHRYKCVCYRRLCIKLSQTLNLLSHADSINSFIMFRLKARKVFPTRVEIDICTRICARRSFSHSSTTISLFSSARARLV